jgi:hypothetical protein
MTVRAWWIPNSERGREVVRTLKAAGFPATYKNTMGRYVCNLPFAAELDAETLRSIAYDMNPERACAEEEDALQRATDIEYHAEAWGFYIQDGPREIQRWRQAIDTEANSWL